MSTISNELRLLLGAESAGAWVKFMDLIVQKLPFLITAGRPTKAHIANSSIGKAGFTSWAEMVTAPSEQEGLAWNISQWKQWRRAFGFVLRHPYLRDLEITASEVVRMANHAGDKFPDSLERWSETTEKRKADGEARRIHSLADAKKVAERALQKADDAQKQVVQLNNTLLVANKRITDLEQLLTKYKKERSQCGEMITNYRNLKWWERVFTPI